MVTAYILAPLFNTFPRLKMCSLPGNVLPTKPLLAVFWLTEQGVASTFLKKGMNVILG